MRLRIGSATTSYEKGKGGYPADLVDDVIAPVRTDLDAFSEAECAVLENHGYTICDAAIATHAPFRRSCSERETRPRLRLKACS